MDHSIIENPVDHHGRSEARSHPASGGHDSDDHGHDHSDHAALFRRKFWVSLLLTLPAVAYSEMLHELTGLTPPSFSGDEWVAPVFGTAVFRHGGPAFLKAGWAEIKNRQPGMMLLIGPRTHRPGRRGTPASIPRPAALRWCARPASTSI
jgi:P-type Cu2+ transporter